ncbi:acyltransferase [Corynebacterium sp. 320]|uniref:acyltransferase family protein n=1 Tax=Corynebacterium TaxID=1716 RepID=UPI00125CB847|nr:MULTISPECIES: acyltransferase [Corynebacterium]KAB1503175.1 acyltransferase [Corynebacterium sp. 320]KAB1550612.1 acyltransferase [Corynebacterium sp. 321]KAB1550973.1 acyltransferase [Corynebacterium sp. 319]KAB3526972.1 acyltransferase [Corynebacterium sp. 250]KAB3538464.1 acyltransferase [Corynebacterium sp. 366]
MNTAPSHPEANPAASSVAQSSTQSAEPSAARSRTPFLPALEGLRAIACCGIIITHVAFQTGADHGSLINRMMARTDFFVPVFFALSGFLLWRRHHADFSLPTNSRHAWTWAGYYVKRVGRIMPACLAMVVIVLLLFPVAENPGWKQVLANLTLTQIYVSGGLVGGLTHLWSLCVEMAFYLVLPVVALLYGRRSPRQRIAIILLVGLISFGWAFIPAFAEPPGPGELNPHVMPPAFTAWFGVGMLGAELEKLKAHGGLGRITPALPVIFGRFRAVWWLVALGALAVAASDGPEGLTHAGPGEFARRTLYGLVFAAALLLPYVLEPRSRFLESSVMQALGRWSYSIFLWHMSLLSLVFPLLGIGLFSGHTALVLVATFVLTVPVAALSFSLVEEPARRAINEWWRSLK